ncbi:hypothetical protein [Phenylobacterium aquaticum]|uniref:hypothetical protein n=1 Tax=Phenylobacterium aquaticum TaxID=1763816 RepID=UPI0026E988C5|nr:hypothetical protein [Phenylobacterium aquaticum]
MFWTRKRPLAAHADGKAPDHTREIAAAYDRGRKDERKARKRHPILMGLTFGAAALGAVVLVLAAKEGSFARSGDVVDQGLAVAADKAEPAVRDAAGGAGDAIKDVGQSLKPADDKAR